MNSKSLFWAGVFLAPVALLHGWFFLYGYRLTADDVAFDWYLSGGLADAWNFTKGVAVTQGRIGHFIDVPISILGAHYAENLYFRLFYTALYFSNFFLVGWYVSLFFGARAGLLSVLVLFSLHPLGYFHLAPNSYPFHVSLPVFLILGSRIAMWYFDRSKEGVFHAPLASALFFCFFGMILSEYGFVFAVALMACEFLSKVHERLRMGEELTAAGVSALRRASAQRDVLLVVLFLAVYLGFRFMYPSSYSGNQLPEEFALYPFLKTTFGHIYGGTSLAAFFRMNLYEAFGFLTVYEIVSAIVVFVCALVAAVLILGCSDSRQSAAPGAGKCWSMVAGGLISAVLVTVPVAITTKYQSWCADIHSCVFLDSRLSYLGVGVLMAGVLFWVLGAFERRAWKDSAVVVAVGSVVAVVAAATFVSNVHVSHDMKGYVAGWERARAMTCLSDEKLGLIRPMLSKVVETSPRISFHTWVDVNQYWERYIQTRRQGGRHASGCDPSVFFQAPPRGVSLFAGQAGAALPYFSTGWSSPEDWGIWSDGAFAEMILPESDGTESLVVEARALVTPEHQSQRFTVKINGAVVMAADFRDAASNRLEVNIPYALRSSIAEQGFLVVRLEFSDSVSPKELGINDDVRKLAIGVRSISLN